MTFYPALGFELGVTNSGAKAYFAEKRISGKNTRITIGKHGSLTPEQARNQAQIILGRIALGNDPVDDKKYQLMKSATLADTYRDYLSAKGNLKPNTLDEYQWRIEGALSDGLTNPMVDITKDMVEARHRKIGETSHAGANGTIRVLKAFFNFAMEQYKDQKGQRTLRTKHGNDEHCSV